MLSMIKSRFQREIICNVVCEECLQITIYIYLLFSQMVSRDMLLSMINSGFLPEIICDAVCEECLQISIYIYPIFSQLVKNDMLLSVITSDFQPESFVMIYVKNVCKYLFIFTPYFLKWWHAACC